MATVYDSDQLIQQYKKIGELPAIHRLMHMAFLKHAPENALVMDLGASVGLMAAGLIKQGAAHVVAIEGSRKAAEKRLALNRVSWFEKYVTPETLPDVLDLARKFSTQVVTARRVLYEIEKQEDGLVNKLASGLQARGVEILILQGCVPVKNPRVKLWNSDLEARALEPFYKEWAQYGPVKVMRSAK